MMFYTILLHRPAATCYLLTDELATGVTCTVDGLHFRSDTSIQHTVYVQGRWSLGTVVYLKKHGVSAVPILWWYLLQLCSYCPCYPFGCLLVMMDGRVFPCPPKELVIPGSITDIHLFYNICPLLLFLVTPHLLVHVSPGYAMQRLL
jgi:hypothetical protein